MAGPADEAARAALAAATNADGSLDDERYSLVFTEEYGRLLAERQEKLRADARATYRAMAGWQRVEDEAAWDEMVQRAEDGIESGYFLMDRLGGEKHLDPELVAALVVLRRRLLDDHQPVGAAEVLLIDTALMAYYHQLRVSGWVTNLAAMLEGEFFGLPGLQASFKESNGHQLGRVKGLRVSEHVQRVSEQLMPLLDRSHRMMMRSLTALQSRRHTPVPSVTIGQAGQVNVGAVQSNKADRSR